MNTFLYVIVIIATVLSFLTSGIYYLWLSFIAFFTKMQHCKDTAYSGDIDMYFFIVIPCLNEESVIVPTVRNLLELNMKNTRVIVVDDDSEDDSSKNIYDAFGGLVTTVENGSVFDLDHSKKPLILLQRR